MSPEQQKGGAFPHSKRQSRTLIPPHRIVTWASLRLAAPLQPVMIARNLKTRCTCSSRRERTHPNNLRDTFYNFDYLERLFIAAQSYPKGR